MKRYLEEKVDLPGKNNNNGEKDSLCNIITCNGFLDVVDPLSPRVMNMLLLPIICTHTENQ